MYRVFWRQSPRLLAAAAALGALGLMIPAIAASQAAGPAPAPRESTASPDAAPRAGGGGFGPSRYAAETYGQVCAGCHGVDLAGGRGPSLFDPKLLSIRSDEQLHNTILNGVPGTEMQAFKGAINEDQAWQIVSYLRTEAANLKPKAAFVPNPANQVIKSQKQTFRIEVVAPGLDTPFGLAFLPDGRLLVTERPGRLRIVGKDGKLSPTPVTGTPKPFVRQDGGYFDVAVDPNYAKSGWIYLSYSELAPGATAPDKDPPRQPGVRPAFPPSMTVIIRGRINARNQWVDTQTIFHARPEIYTGSVIHYGSRFAFDHQGHLFFTLGERGEFTNAQKLDTPLGKVHRVNLDGSIPADNPFVKTPGAVRSIWTIGHRNPQGLAWDPVTGLLWESEHGPTGGDEINILEKRKNYGWGVATMGIQPGITKRSEPGMEQPIAYYTPAIAPSGITFYAGARYPGWKNDLFVSGLTGQSLRRLEVKGREVVSQEVLFQQFGRTRAVITGPDGLLYVLLQNPTGAGTGLSLAAPTPGMVVRLVPQN